METSYTPYSGMGLLQASGGVLNMRLFTWLTFTTRLLLYVILKSCDVDERILLNLFGGVTNCYRENKDFGSNEDDAKVSSSDWGAGNGDGGGAEYMSEDGEDGDSEMEDVSEDGSGSDEEDEEDEDGSGSDEDDEEDEEDEYDGYDSPSSDTSSDDEPLLKHAREMYSEKSFCIFEHEYKKSIALLIDNIKDNYVFEYEVRLDHFNTHHRVIAFGSEEVVTCSCNYFLVTGMLCCHALLVLHCLHIDQIPKHYLLNWRLKSDKIDLATKLSVIKERNHKQRRWSSDDNFPNKSINKRLHEMKFEEHYSSAIEDDEEEDNSDETPVGSSLLRHAKEIYISNIADMFQKEYINSQYLRPCSFMESMEEGGFMVKCEVFEPAHSGECKIIHAYPADGTINCSCNKFERDGILCCHALAVLVRLCIVRIPRQYLHEKFLKNVTTQVKDIHGPQYSELARFLCYSLVQRWVGTSLASDHHMIMARSLYNQYLAAGSSKLVNGKRDHCKAKRQKELKKNIRFSDDQALKNFVYKELKLQDGASEEFKSRRQRQILHFVQCPNPGGHEIFVGKHRQKTTKSNARLMSEEETRHLIWKQQMKKEMASFKSLT